MPRTKRPAKKQDRTSDVSDNMKKLAKIVDEEKNNIDSVVQMKLRDIKLHFKYLRSWLGEEMLLKTIGQLKSEELASKGDKPSQRTTRSLNSVHNDDGYLTANSSQGSGGRGATKKHLAVPKSSCRKPSSRRSRSADASARKIPSTIDRYTQRHRSQTVYRTPAYNKNAIHNYPLITPKVAPETPLTLLRRPRQGEVAFAVTGSPLMVSSCDGMTAHEKANCNILLNDGTMLSLQPKQLRENQTCIPYSLMDNTIWGQLKTIKENLDIMMKQKEKVMK